MPTTPGPAPSIWTQAPPPPRQRSLGREEIVAAAIGLADESGPAALTMKAVARRLGPYTSMALYPDVYSKERAIEQWMAERFPDGLLAGDIPVEGMIAAARQKAFSVGAEDDGIDFRAVRHRFAEEIERRLGIRLICGYAMSESPYGTIWPPGTRPYGTLGTIRQQPTLGRINEGRVMRDDRPVPPGDVGELELRNPAVMLGYWGMPDETARVIRPDGWLRTGDLVVENPDGTYTFVGREKEIIRRRGENLSPGEVEEALATHRRNGDRHGEARVLANLGDVAADGGDTAGAESLYQESLKLRAEQGDRIGMATVLDDPIAGDHDVADHAAGTGEDPAAEDVVGLHVRQQRVPAVEHQEIGHDAEASDRRSRGYRQSWWGP